MPYEAIKVWKQYDLQQIAYTGNYGIRMIGDRYCVALGTGSQVELGQYFDLVLENGTIIPCIMCDIKANIHTDSANIFTVASDCCSEFIVDDSCISQEVKNKGDISFCDSFWNSPVKEIRIYDNFVE